MINFSELNLSRWEKEELAELCEEYPNFENMSIEELDKLVCSLFWRAQGLVETANILESKANAILRYIDEIEE